MKIEEIKKTVKIEDGATRIENKVFRIAGRVLGYGILVTYAVLFLKAKSKGESFPMESYEYYLLGGCVVVVFAVELIRAIAKKKFGV